MKVIYSIFLIKEIKLKFIHIIYNHNQNTSFAELLNLFFTFFFKFN